MKRFRNINHFLRKIILIIITLLLSQKCFQNQAKHMIKINKKKNRKIKNSGLKNIDESVLARKSVSKKFDRFKR